MYDKSMLFSIDEALQTGGSALLSFEGAKNSLNFASGLGFLDIFGGGFIISTIKQGKLAWANSELSKAFLRLRLFREAFDSIPIPDMYLAQSSSFLTLTDSFLDNPISDLIVQSNILTLKGQVTEAISNVNQALDDLRLWKDYLIAQEEIPSFSDDIP